MRIDQYLFEKGYTKSRQKAKSLIESECVFLDSISINKPSFAVDDTKEYSITINDNCPYVSRGGLKLEAMIKHLDIDLKEKTAVDIGSSTGGFTDCLLKNGIKKVYAVDSGTNQLDKKLINDNRIVLIENFNAKNLTVNDIGEKVDIVTIDVSFISQTLLLSNAFELLKEGGILISLIKPQFEVGKGNLGKGGIVKDEKTRKTAVENVKKYAENIGLKTISLLQSPIKGGSGNIEYLISFYK